MSETNNNKPKISFHHQPCGDQSIGELIECLSENADRISIATAFLRKEGLELLKGIINKTEIRIICGINGGISDVKTLGQYTKKSKGKLKGRVFRPMPNVKMFHSKLYIFENGNVINIILGSTNFTKPGLWENEEVNIKIVGMKDKKPYTSIMDYFNDLWSKNRSEDVNTFLKNNNYKMAKNNGDKLKIEKKIKWSKINNHNDIPVSVVMDYVTQFENPVNQTLINHGQQTVLKRSENYLAFEKYWIKSREKSVNKWKIRVLDKGDFAGSLYKEKSSNKKNHNFRIQVHKKGKDILVGNIKSDDWLKYEFDFENEICRITKTKKVNK